MKHVWWHLRAAFNCFRWFVLGVEPREPDSLEWLMACWDRGTPVVNYSLTQPTITTSTYNNAKVTWTSDPRTGK